MADATAALPSSMEAMVSDPGRMGAMGKAARYAMESRSFEAAFCQTWKMFCLVNTEKLFYAIDSIIRGRSPLPAT